VLVWTQTLASIASARIANDEPWGRTAIILGATAAVAALGALALQHPRVREHYRDDATADAGS